MKFGTYRPGDVNILLKDITGLVAPTSTKEREAIIQGGGHYSEMLPIEYVPSSAYMTAFEQALSLYSPVTAAAVACVARQIHEEKKGETVLVSLARAGTPIGVMIKHYIEKTWHVPVYHYTISIIRGRGIDKNAMDYILSRHKPESIQFVDGWIGKGAIQRELDAAMADYPNVSPGLAVLSDPAGEAEKTGSTDDFLIASSCLNATVSGLLSRTFLRGDIIGPRDFHGAAFYGELEKEDVTYRFIDGVEAYFPAVPPMDTPRAEKGAGLRETREIADHYGISDINLVKPGIGEATRVLLRRMPWKILVHSLSDEEHLGHLYQLAREKGIALEIYPLRHYRACGLIRQLADT